MANVFDSCRVDLIYLQYVLSFHTRWKLFFTWDALVLKGKVKVNAATDSLEEEPYHTLVLSQEQNQTGVAIQATEDETELVVVRHTSGPMIIQINPLSCARLRGSRLIKELSNTGLSVSAMFSLT